MPDYKEMYYIMVRATEKAIQTLVEAQQQCEELYLAENSSCIHLLNEQHSMNDE